MIQANDEECNWIEKENELRISVRRELDFIDDFAIVFGQCRKEENTNKNEHF